jgi:hypothetical protein
MGHLQGVLDIVDPGFLSPEKGKGAEKGDYSEGERG